MTKNLISKYYYHYYVIFMMFILGISGTCSVLFFNFSSTENVNLYAFFISIVLYFGITLYFLYLFKKQQWAIPRQWINFQKRPLLYCLIIFPVIFIPIFWMNFAKLIPMIYTERYGIETVEILEANAKKYTSKGNTYSYCLSNQYSCLPIFKLSDDEFKLYQNKKVILQITSKKSSFGTIIESIDHIQF